MPNPPTRRPSKDPRKAAEAMFRPAQAPGPVPSQPALPGARELVSLRIDNDVLEHFQKDGPGWQDRINAFLRGALGV